MKALMWAAVAAAFGLVLWVLYWDHADAMERCQERMSYDTCVYSLR